MLTSRSKIMALAAVCVTALSGLQARAADLQPFTFLPVSSWTTNAIVMKFDGVGSIYAGRYKANLGSMPGIDIFCTDFVHRIQENESYNTLANLGRVTDAPAPAMKVGTEWFYATGSPGSYLGAGLSSAMSVADYDPNNLGVLNAAQRSAAVGYLGDLYLSGSLTKVQLAAIQTAIWDIVQDGGDGLSAGDVRVTRANQNADGMAAYDLFPTYLNAALPQTGYAAQTTFWIQDGTSRIAADYVSRSAHSQDFLYKGPVPAPEPLSMTLTGLGLAMVGAVRRRRKS